MKIGVSGASGHLGAAVVKELKARAGGHQIVAITRSPDKVAGAGVEARFGDYDQPESLRAAYAGLDRLVLIPTTDLAPGKRATQNVAAVDAAVAAGVRHIVAVSGNARNVPEPAVGASYFAGEQQLMRKAPQWTILRMNYFAESFAQEAQMSLAHGVITGVGESKVAFVSRDDLAAAIAGVLGSDGHNGAIYYITGPAALSGEQRAAAVAKASGKAVAFLALPTEVLRGQLAQAGLPADVVNIVISIQEGFVAGDFNIVSGDVERLTGKPPRSLDEVLAAAFRG